jgi:hypothetical protein
MNKNNYSRTGLIHLYNPKEEGLGSYDINYVNAYKVNQIDKKIEQTNNERHAR